MFKDFFKKKAKDHKCDCQKSTTTLNDAPTGSSMRIECIQGEEGTCHRLREMGFCESSVVEKIAQSGSLICRVCDSKVIISKSLAKNIIVNDVCQHKGAKANVMLLSQMSAGQKAVIEDFLHEGEEAERLQEMGLTPGENVEIIRYAPLGDPIEIKIRGYLLSLRKQEADLIKVKLL